MYANWISHYLKSTTVLANKDRLCEVQQTSEELVEGTVEPSKTRVYIEN